MKKDQLTGSYGKYNPVVVKSDSGFRYPNDIIYHEDHDDVIYVQSENRQVHSNQKPVELGRYAIKTYSNPGDIVLDNCCGSDSFLVAAVLENRKFIGIEKYRHGLLFKKDPIDTIDICEKRVAAAIESMKWHMW